MNGYPSLEQKRKDSNWKSSSKKIDIKNLLKKTHWDFASKNEDDDFHTDVVFLQVACDEIRKEIGDAHQQALIFYEGYCGEFYFEKSNTIRLCDKLIKKLLNEKNFRDNFNSNIYEVSDDLSSVFNGLERSDFNKLPTGKLQKLYKEQLLSQKELYKKCWIAEIVQVPHIGLADHLVNHLKKQGLSDAAAEKIFYQLCRSKKDSVYVEEEKQIISTAERISDDSQLAKKFNQPIKYLRTHVPVWLYDRILSIKSIYGYLGYHGYGDRSPYSLDEYLKRIKVYVLDPGEIEKEKMKWTRDNDTSPAFESLGIEIDKVTMDIFELYGELAVSKAYRRLAQLKNFFFLDELLSVISRRFNVTESTLRFMMPEEVISLMDGTLSPETLESCKIRCHEMAFTLNNSESIFIEDISVSEIKNLLSKDSPEDEKHEKILKGRSACVGLCRGRAVVIERNSKSTDFNYGDIIVSLEADPDLIPLMKKAGAIVTDQGGITCHAAVIAREFNIPCVTGTLNATKMIKDGDYLFVDANKGEVIIDQAE